MSRLTIALIAACALLLAWGLRVDHLRAGHKAAHAQTILSYKEVQRLAQLAFDAKITLFQQQNRISNEQAAANYTRLSTDYDARVKRLQSATAACPAYRANVPADRLSSGGITTSEETKLSPELDLRDDVIIPRADAQICASNTARLETVRDWALSLQP